jgi:hypothetical protein
LKFNINKKDVNVYGFEQKDVKKVLKPKMTLLFLKLRNKFCDKCKFELQEKIVIQKKVFSSDMLCDDCKQMLRNKGFDV